MAPADGHEAGRGPGASATEHALRRSEERLKLATEAAGIGIWERDLSRDRFYFDERVRALYGITDHAGDWSYRRWRALVHPEDLPGVESAFREAFARNERFEVEFRIQRLDTGATRYIRAVGQYTDDEQGRLTRAIGINEDVTEYRRLQQELERRACQDPLTNLFNRAKIHQLQRAAEAAWERHGVPFSVVLFDVDLFKQINDRWGHNAGDAVLWELARRIRGALRDEDHIGRWGGEEFLIVAAHADEPAAGGIAERVRRAAADRPFEEVGTVTVSLGVAGVEPGVSLRDLQYRADQALYAAKGAGRNCVRRYSQIAGAVLG